MSQRKILLPKQTTMQNVPNVFGLRFSLLKLLLLTACLGATLLICLRPAEVVRISIQSQVPFPKLKEFHIRFKNIRLTYWMELPSKLSPACPPATKLLILIMSRRGAFQNRQGIRKTWLRDAVDGTQVRFLIADIPLASGSAEQRLDSLLAEQKELEWEQLRHRDLVFQHGIRDRYENLHFKVWHNYFPLFLPFQWLSGLQWQQAFCPQAQWIMKTDDDTVVHLPRLDYWIETKFRLELRRSKASYFGWIISGVGPIRDPNNKWFVPSSAYPGDKYPAYMQGATYVASNAAIRAILPYTRKVDGFNMDDVLFTGLLADMAKVRKSDHKEMFRVGSQLQRDESCEGGIPHVTALYGAGSQSQYERIYAQLKMVDCFGK